MPENKNKMKEIHFVKLTIFIYKQHNNSTGLYYRMYIFQF